MIRVPSPAKLNLFLHITGRRDNGYHELQTIFQLIDLYDWMTFDPIAEENIQIEGLSEVKLEQNLIYRAAQLLRPHAKKPCGLKIQIEKNIPMGAGLGGGSSNAATTLIPVPRNKIRCSMICGYSTIDCSNVCILCSLYFSFS